MNFQETVGLARRLAASGDRDAESIIQAALDETLEQEPLDLSREAKVREGLRNHLLGFGVLQNLIDDPAIEEIWVNGPAEVFIARRGISQSLPISIDHTELRVIVERMLRSTGRRLDRSSPFVDASLPDGSRLHVVIPDITREHWSLNIRKFPRQIISLGELLLTGAMRPDHASYLATAMASRKNILISGATQSGKTTVLCALLNEIADNQRVVSVEETFELRISKPDWVALQTRQANLEGIGEVSLRRLVKEALRMRPDRLVVGEVREAEALDMLIALNSGLPGACTIHANSARDAIAKLCTLPLLAGNNISTDFVRPTVGSCIDVVVHCQLNPDGSRSISQIVEVSWDPNSKNITFAEVPDALV